MGADFPGLAHPETGGSDGVVQIQQHRGTSPLVWGQRLLQASGQFIGYRHRHAQAAGESFPGLAHIHDLIGNQVEPAGVIVVADTAFEDQQRILLHKVPVLGKGLAEHGDFYPPGLVIQGHECHTLAAALAAGDTQGHHQAGHRCRFAFTRG